MTKRIVAIDFDGTIAQYLGWRGPHELGDPIKGVSSFLRGLKEAGHIVCIWTTRPAYKIRQWLEYEGLDGLVDYINATPHSKDEWKIGSDCYVGDDAIPFDGNWEGMLEKVLNFTKHWEQSREVPQGFREDWNKQEVQWSSQDPRLHYGGVGQYQLEVFEEHFQRLLDTWQVNPEKTVLLTLCSWAKPYFTGYIWYVLRKELSETGYLDRLEHVHLSSAGVIPHSRCDEYPFAHYDWDNSKASPEVVTLLCETMTRRLDEWYHKVGFRYKQIVVYMRDPSNTIKSVRSSALMTCGKCTIVGASIEDSGVMEVREGLHKFDPDDYLLTEWNMSRLTDKLSILTDVQIV